MSRAAVVIAALSATAAAALARAATVVSYPGPGWRAVSPSTGITFRGVPAAADLAGLEVTRAESGPHAGALHDLRLVRGAVFEPDTRSPPAIA